MTKDEKYLENIYEDLRKTHCRPEKIPALTKREMQKRLGISRNRYEQFIRVGILPSPVKPGENARAVHSEEDIEIFSRNFDRLSL